jgi:GNAT superfamily N-acetyltransferase
VITIEREDFDSPDATTLHVEHKQALDELYGYDAEPGKKPTAAEVPVFLVMRIDGELAGCGGLRPIEPGLVEIKRMYVRRAYRGRGLGRLILEALEAQALELGAERVVLETGVEQIEAIGLYEGSGYRAIPCFGAYAASPISHCYERALTTPSRADGP